MKAEILIQNGLVFTGKWVMPGFIDSHTHYDAEVLASPGLKESARHRLTTVI